MNTLNLSQLAHNPSCMDDYDPNAMSVTQAKHFISQFLNPVQDIEATRIEEALGRVLAVPVVSTMNVPSHDNSAMDGYAFRYAEGGRPLKVAGTALAGRPYSDEIAEGCCIRIMTGANIPSGLDTVVMQEHVTVSDQHIAITRMPSAGANVRLIGEDVSIGQTVLASGKRIQAADMGLLASLGVPVIQSYRKLKVAYFSTGDELVSVGQALQTGQIYDSNRYSLRGMLQSVEVVISDLGNVADDPEALEHTLLNAAKSHDVVITSGGVSVGEADYMKALLAKHGQVLFWKINMKPGRPLAYGKIGDAHYFGLPGNPVSTMVTFYQFVQDALRRLSGEVAKPEPLFEVECTSVIKKATGRTEYQRGILFEDQGVWKVKITGGQSSAMLSSMSLANCFIVLDEQVGNIEAGARVKVQPFFGVLSL